MTFGGTHAKISDLICTTTTTTTTTNTNPIPPKFCIYSSRRPLSASTSSIYCRPERARPSGSTVVECPHAHECLTSETFLIDPQSDNGSPTSSLGSSDRLPGTVYQQHHHGSQPHCCGLCARQVFRPSVITPPRQDPEIPSYPIVCSYIGGFEDFDQRLVCL